MLTDGLADDFTDRQTRRKAGIRILEDDLNLRTEPNTKSAVLSQLYYGQPLLVLQEQGEWLQVKTDELTGYVMAEFVAQDQ